MKAKLKSGAAVGRPVDPRAAAAAAGKYVGTDDGGTKPRSRKESGQARAPPFEALLAFTIPEFARLHGFSPAYYYILRARGEGPQEMRLGRRVLVSREAAARWRETREAEHEKV
jgi:hypothetical protein